MNLGEYVSNGKFNYDAFTNDSKIATIFLNTILDEGLSLHPLKIQRETVNEWKAMGLGIMNLAGALIKLKLTYGSPEAIKESEKIMNTLLIATFEQSCDLNKDNKPFEGLFDSDFYKKMIYPNISDKYKNKYPRNCQLLTIAPTGSISTLLNLASGGAEPVFALSYTRTTKSLEKRDITYKVYMPLAKKYMEENNCSEQELPEYFITSDKVPYKNRIAMQAALQKYVDASISSTLNLDESVTKQEVFDIYMNGWEFGCKGITIFRRNCARIAILNDSKTSPKEEPITTFNSITPISRKKLGVTSGSTYCKKCSCGTLYITCNKDQNGNLIEIFTHTSKGGICQANLNAETRMASLALRSGVKVDEVVDQLKGISCPACIAIKAKGGKVDGISCADIIAKTIQEFQNTNVVSCCDTKPIQETKPEKIEYEECPECHEKTLIHSTGCVSCPSCGYSRCN